MCEIIDEIRREGRAEGRAQGRKEGRAEGMAEGEAIGLSKGIKAVVISMLKTGKYSLSELASHSGLSLDEVKALQASLS